MKTGKSIKLNLTSPFPQMSFSSVEIEHEGDTRGDPNDRFEIGSGISFTLRALPSMKEFCKGDAKALIKKLEPLEHMSVYAG